MICMFVNNNEGEGGRDRRRPKVHACLVHHRQGYVSQVHIRCQVYNNLVL